MRGSPHPAFIVHGKEGIIPAHAGLTFAMDSDIKDDRDHPRACGAHPFSGRPFKLELGSSPRMRGSLTLPLVVLDEVGIIPAHAGLTLPL